MLKWLKKKHKLVHIDSQTGGSYVYYQSNLEFLGAITLLIMFVYGAKFLFG